MKSVKMGDDKIVVSSGDQFYDDCPICRAMQKAEKEKKGIDPIELAKAFNEANKMGGISGSLIKNPKHD